MPKPLSTQSPSEEDKLEDLCVKQVKHISQCKNEQPCSGCLGLARQLKDDIEEYIEELTSLNKGEQ